MGPTPLMDYSVIMTMPVSTTTSEMLAELVRSMRGQVVDGIRVHDATAEVDFQVDGETIVRLRLLIDDPLASAPTWPLETCGTLTHLAWSEARRLDIQEWVVVWFVGLSKADPSDFPETPDGR